MPTAKEKSVLDFDYTSLFRKRMVHKPFTWGEIPAATTIGPKQTIALQRIAREGIIEIQENVGTTDDCMPSYKDSRRIEYIVTRPPILLFTSMTPREFYYVNTRGNTSARYALRLPYSLISGHIPELARFQTTTPTELYVD